jgi:L-asparaginase
MKTNSLYLAKIEKQEFFTMDKRKVLILGFGGTIAMVPDASGVLTPAKSIEEILAIVPSLREMADVELVQVENKDSTNITPSHWAKLALKVAEIHGDYDAIIVTHGTDTMAYTAGAVSLALGRELEIPIVFTGSQLPLIAYGSDARFNLENAMKTVLEACKEKIAEVMIVFNDLVLRASRTVKISEAKFGAFDSPAFPHLSQITATGVWFIPQTLKVGDKTPNIWFNTKPSAEAIVQEIPRVKKAVLDIKPHFQRGILSVEIVPGLEPGILMAVLKSGTCQGLLLKSLGAGNVPSEEEYSILPVIEAATVKYKVPVLVSTKFVGGNTHMDIYEPGKLAMEAGAIPTGDMTDVMAQIKFMWALAQGHRDRKALEEVIKKSFVGEIS